MSSQTFYEFGNPSNQVPMTDQLSKTPTASGTIQTFMEVTAAIDKQTSVQAVLKSLHKLFSAVVHFDSIGIGLLTHEGNSLRLIAFERGPAEPQLELGTETPYSGTGAGRAIEEQRTVHIPDAREALLNIPCIVS